MAGAYRTQDDLVKEALKNLGVLSAGNAPDAEDYNYVDEKVDPTIRLLQTLDIAYVGDPANIPGEMFSPLADVLAHECASKFGSTADDRIMLASKGLGGPPSQVPYLAGSAALALRQMNRGRPTFEPARIVSF